MRTGKLRAGAFELSSKCDICGKNRAAGNHQKCSRKRQRIHEQILLNEDFDNLLMDDKK